MKDNDKTSKKRKRKRDESSTESQQESPDRKVKAGRVKKPKAKKIEVKTVIFIPQTANL